MPRLSLVCFGAFQAYLDDARLTNFHSTKVQGLLAYLAVEGSRPHARESLTALFWPDDAPQSAQQSLRQALYALRRTLGDTDNSTREPFLLVTRQTVQFNPAAAYTLDVATFLQQAQQGKLEQAVTLYTAELLTGMSTDSAPFEEWLRSTRQYLHNLALNALTQLTQQQLDRSDYRQALLYARRQLALEPWREEAHRQVMTALAYNGDRSAALAQYETCRRVLVEELRVEPAAETIALYEQIRAGKLRGQSVKPNPLPASPSVGEEPLAPRHNLPPQPTPFIGRTTDLEQITTRLDDPTCRLLTIVGPGGMGKTRLAIEAAQSILEVEPPVDNLKSKIANPKFEDGIYFVALAGVASPDLLVSTIATALDFTFYGNGEPQQQLLAYLQKRSLLLLLDNCEHLLNGIDLVSDLLSAAPGVKVLATSREPLNLREEWLHPLSGMSFPIDETHIISLESYTAVQFFAQCARRMNPSFDLAAEGDAVIQICRLVGGMPLAIELAATWLKFYPCTQIVEEIHHSFDFLTTTLRNIPARHRSMRAVFAHSWQLLQREEQDSFARLAVFQGGFTQAAAAVVAGATRSQLLSLVEKSLLQLTTEGRFHLHELLRQFAQEQLLSLPQADDEAKDRHCTYYLAFLHQQESQLKGREQRTAVTRIEVEIENIRAAWQWAVNQQKLEVLDRALDGLDLFYYAKSWFRESEAALRHCANRLTSDDIPLDNRGILLGKVLARQAAMTRFFGSELGQVEAFAVAEQLANQSLTLLNRLGDPKETGIALLILGELAFGDFEYAAQLSQQALARFAEKNDQWRMAQALADLGMISFTLGNYTQAIHYYQQGATLCEANGNLTWLGDNLNRMGEAYKALGELKQAKASAQAALTARTAAGDRRGIGWSLQLLSDVTWRMGDLDTAQAYAEESLTLFQQIGLTTTQGVTLNILGNIAYSRGHYTEAKTYFQRVIELQATKLTRSSHWMVFVALVGLATLLTHERKRMQAVELLTHTLASPTAWQETKDRATELLTKLEALLPPEQFSAAQQRAATSDLFTLVTELL